MARIGRRSSKAVLFLAAALASAATRAQTARPSLGAPIVPTLDRPCRDPASQDIVVCGRREERRSPYRIPPPPDQFDPASEVDSVSRERNGLLDYGDTGIHSCSTVGPGGYTGCTFKKWKADREQFGRERPRPRKPR